MDIGKILTNTFVDKDYTSLKNLNADVNLV